MLSIMAAVVVLVAGAGEASPPSVEDIVDRMVARLEQFDAIPVFHVALDCSSLYGLRHQEFARSGPDVRFESDGLKKEQDAAANSLGDNGSIRCYENGWMKEIHRQPTGDTRAFRYTTQPPEPRFESRLMLGFPCWMHANKHVKAVFFSKDARSNVLPAQDIGEESCVGVERTFAWRLEGESYECHESFWLIPGKNMALKRYEYDMKRGNRSETHAWEMEEFVELAPGFWMATRARLEEQEKAYEMRVTAWSRDPIDLHDPRLMLDFPDGVEVSDGVFNEHVRWKQGWTIPEMIVGKKGCGMGLRPDELRLKSNNTKALAQALLKALPESPQGSCEVTILGGPSDLAEQLRALVSTRKGLTLAGPASATGRVADEGRPARLSCTLAPVDERHMLAVLALSAGHDDSDWAVLFERAQLGGTWRVCRQGDKSTTTWDPMPRDAKQGTSDKG